MKLDMIFWLAKRTLTLDFKYLTRLTEDNLYYKLEFIVKKYFILARHLFFKFKLGNDMAIINGRNLFYNSPVGFAGYQAVLSEHNFWLRQLDISKKPLFVDIGANVGYFSLGVKKIFPSAEIHCFEPVALTHSCLVKNLKNISNIKILRFAVGNRSGFTRIHSDRDQSSLSSIGLGNDAEKVRMIRLDTYSRRFPKTREIDLLKIDVEGYELEVITGALKTIQRTKYIHMEFNSSNYNLSELMNTLAKSKRGFQLLFARNFSNDTDSKFESGDILLKVL